MDRFALAAVALAVAPLAAGAGVLAGRTWLDAAARPRLGLWLALAATVGLWASAVGPTGLLMAPTLLLGWTLLVLAVVDAVDLRLPDLLTLPLAAAGLAVAFAMPQANPLDHLAGAALGWAVLAAVAWAYRRWRGRDGLGMGDAKLMAAAGAWLGWRPLPTVLLIGCALALVWVLFRVATRGRAAASERIAFGTPLCLAFWIAWLHGAALVAR